MSMSVNAGTEVIVRYHGNIRITIKETYYFTYLFTTFSSSACTNEEFTKLMNCWTFGTAFNGVQLIAKMMESASSRLRTGQRRTL